MYWGSVIMFLFVIENVTTWYNDWSIRGKLSSYIGNMIRSLSLVSDSNDWVLVLIIMLLLSVLFLRGINDMVSLIRFKKGKRRGRYPLFRFIRKKEFIVDVVLGIWLMYFGVKTFRSYYIFFERGRITGGFVSFLLLLIVGSLGYCYSIFPFGKYYWILSILKKEKFLGDIWYGITNDTSEISVFSELPDREKGDVAIVDSFDLRKINRIFGKQYRPESFTNCIMILNSEYEIKNNFAEEVKIILQNPHIRILLYVTGRCTQASSIKEYVRGLQKIRRIDLHEVPRQITDGSFQIYPEFKTEYKSELRKYEIHGDHLKGNPSWVLTEEKMQKAYLTLNRGPKICFDFFTACLNELEMMQSIYALFDYIDLQYRVALSFIAGEKTEWYKKNTRKIGNINDMATILDDETSFFDKEIFFEGGNTFTGEEARLIHVYLPNYEMTEKYYYNDVVYLSNRLRNVLRGHGNIRSQDTYELYVLVLKLSMLTNCILHINEAELYIKDGEVWGNYKGIRNRKMSLFYFWDGKGELLVFNNWIKGKFEYINYLNGRIIWRQV